MRTAAPPLLLLLLLLMAPLACGGGTTREVIGGASLLFDDPPSMHGRVARSALVARVRFVSVEPVGVRDIVLRDGYTYRAGYVAALEYTFGVLEYLKGTGGAEGHGVGLRVDHAGMGRPGDPFN